MKKTNSSLHLDFGDPALEIFNIISAHDTMMIKSLEYCVRSIAPEMFHDRLGLPARNLTHGGSNVTYLTGVFQHVLPDILEKIVASTIHPMNDESKHFWTAHIRSLGVRTVYVESFANVKPKMTKEERRAIRYAKYLEDKQRTVTLGGGETPAFVEDEDEEEEEEEEYEYDEQADENVRPFMKDSSISLYKAFVLLSDRSHFSGGEMYLAREKEDPPSSSSRTASNSDGEDDADVYDEEDEDVGEIHDEREHLKGIVHKKKKRSNIPRYNARTAKVARYTPEKGSVLLFRADYKHGMGTLHRGKRWCLVMEFWPYADAEMGKKRPTVSEARPLPRRWQDL
jgi:hypothetical protein